MGQASDGKTWNQSLAYLLDAANHPIFLTRPSVILAGFPSAGRLDIDPLRLLFEQDGEVTGVVWWGPVETIVALSSVVPDSFFQSTISASVYRNPARSNRDEALNYMLRDILATLTYDTSIGIRFFQSSETINFRSTGRVRNIAFTAIGTAFERGQSIEDRGLIHSAGSPIKARGLWFIGNLKISNDLTGSPRLLSESTYRITGFNKYIFGVDKDGDSPSESIVINFDGFREGLPNPDYNFTWNNLHLLNNDFRYTRSSGQSMQGQTVVIDNALDTSGSNWKVNGPAIDGVFAPLQALATANGIHFHQAFSPTEPNTQGWVGKFGNFANLRGSSGSLINKSKGIGQIVNGFLGAFKNSSTYLKPAAVSFGDLSAFVPIPSNPGEVSNRILYPTLNVEVVGIRRGINTGVYYGVGAGGSNVTVDPYPTEISRDLRL
jgi:hypothetical protein